MRILAWLGIGLVLLLGASVLVADFVVTGLVNRDPWRARIDQLVDESVGRDVAWGTLGVGLLPPSLVIEDASIAGAQGEAEPFVSAESLQLHLALLPLLARAVVVDSLVVRGASVRLVRTKDGLELPDFGAARREAGPEETEREPGATAVAIRKVVLEDARLVFQDRSLSPPRDFALVDVDARVEGSGPDDPFRVDVAMQSDGGGLARLRGTAGLDQQVELALELEAFPLQPLDPYLMAAQELDGRASGNGTIEGPLGAPRKVTLDLEVADARMRFQETVIEGPLSWQVEHRGPWSEPNGRFRIDATRARASLAGVYEKAPGRPATVTGRLVTRDGVIRFDDVELKIENADVRGSVDFGPRNHAQLRLAPVELERWPSLLAPLHGYELSGRLSAERWELWGAPLQVKGEVRFDQVYVAGPEGRAFTVDGRLRADGDTLRSEGLVLDAAGQRLPLGLEVDDLAGAWRYRVRTAGTGLDANALLARLAGDPDTLFGPLDLDGDLTGSLVGVGGVLDALGGQARFRISPGRLKGISILEATLERLSRLRGSGPLASLLFPRGGLAASMSRYYKDEFRDLSASLSLGGGFARTQDLRLLAEGYEFTMQGQIGLADLDLDARGEIKLGQELTQTLARSFGLQQMPLMQAIVIPIPRLRGTVTDPKPEPDFTYLLRFLTGNLPGARGVRKLLDGLDGVLQQPILRPAPRPGAEPRRPAAEPGGAGPAPEPTDAPEAQP